MSKLELLAHAAKKYRELQEPLMTDPSFVLKLVAVVRAAQAYRRTYLNRDYLRMNAVLDALEADDAQD